MSSEIWKSKFPVPVVQMIPVDSDGNILVMHRSDKVRSAKNVWSFPSGLTESGEPWDWAATREMREEYELDVLKLKLLGIYENIAGDEELQGPQWHWLIIVCGALVEDCTTAINKEPDKHDKLEFIKINEIMNEDFVKRYPFHKSFTQFLNNNSRGIYEKLQELTCTRQ